MCDQERAQFIRLNDELTELVRQRRALLDEQPRRLRDEDLQPFVDEVWELRKSTMQTQVNMQRMRLDLARDLFIRAGGDPSTLPDPVEAG